MLSTLYRRKCEMESKAQPASLQLLKEDANGYTRNSAALDWPAASFIPWFLKTCGLASCVNQFAAERYAQELCIRYYRAPATIF
jgi:hypothetical protein